MKRLIPILLIAATSLISCSKYKDETPAIPAGSMSVTTAVKTGDWMINTYTENGSSIVGSLGIVYFKFSTTGTVVASKNGTDYNGTYTEAKTETTHTFTINVSSADGAVQKANGAWKVTGVSEYFIDLSKSGTTNSTMNLMKH